MDKNSKDTKYTIHITRRMNLVRKIKNSKICIEQYNIKEFCKWQTLQLAEIGTKNVRDDELNPILEYTMVRLDSCQNTCTIGVKVDRRVWGTRRSDDSTWLSWYEIDSISFKCSIILKCW